MRTKYNSEKIKLPTGEVFDSKKEYGRWGELKLLERAGKISQLQRQVRYELIPAQYESFPRYGKNGKRIKDGRRCAEKEVIYIADFVYTENGKTVVEDCKGYRDPKSTAYAKYAIKRKLMRWRYGLVIRET